MVDTHLYHQECCHRGLGYVFGCPQGDPHNYFGVPRQGEYFFEKGELLRFAFQNAHFTFRNVHFTFTSSSG